jgi:small nuclear ribonucleoprotein (snRNP)-like protein
MIPLPRMPFRKQGFDEFMNLVLDDAEEVYIEKSGKETKARQDLGKW